MMKKKRTPIGISDFKKLITENCYLIDKTLLIKDVVEGADVILYPRPRRFGKTLNLSMLRYFYDNSSDNSALFKDFQISSETEIMQKQGRHPVIYISFKDVKSLNFANCMENIGEVLACLYEEHRYLLNNNVLSSERQVVYQNILCRRASQVEYENSLKYLSEYLGLYHKANPVILIDEYDMPIQAAYSYNYYEELIIFIRNLLSGCLKDNIYLEKAVLTGILRVAKESIFLGLNNLKVLSMIADTSADKFGFTQNEVELCLKDHGIESRLPEVKEWYDGYNFGQNTEIYNPWSILNYVDEKVIRPYWVNTSGNYLIKSILQTSFPAVKESLEKLIVGGSIHEKINDNIVYKDVGFRKDALWNFLLMSGYLRFDNLVLDEVTYYADLRIPNKEVQYLFETEIVTGWFSINTISYDLPDILHNLTKGDLNIFRKTFIEFCISSFSYFDVSGNEPEKFYHAFVLGMIVTLRKSYMIKSNRESGYGRYDIMLIPHDKTGRGIIFEFKKVDISDKEDFSSAMTAAKKQISDKKYAVELQGLGVNNIVNIVAVFDKKEVEVEVFY